MVVDTVAMLDHALHYLEQGLPVFPICSPVIGKPGWCVQHGDHAAVNARRAEQGQQGLADPGKHPLVRWAEFQHRLPTEDEIREWWRKWPSANIGMATGALSGLVVLDCDGLDAYTAVLSRGGVEPTRTVVTGKPNGFHWYLRHPGRKVTNFAGDRGVAGLDFRGDGGFVVLPPSLHQSGNRYQWVAHTVDVPIPVVPLWLLNLLTDRAQRNGTAPETEGRSPLDLSRVLDGVPQGERDATIYRTACRMRADNVPQAYAEILIRQMARSCSPPFPETDAVSKITEAYRRFAPNVRLELTSDGELVAAAPAVLPDGDYPLQSIHELLTTAEIMGDQLVEGIIWANRLTWAYAAPGAGKTLFLMAVAMHLAAGRPFCGRAVTPGAVLLIEEDSPLSVLAEYTETLADIYDFRLEDLPFYVNREQGLRIIDDTGLARAIAAVEQCEPAPIMVIVDACERITPSDRFNSREFDPLARFLQWLINRGTTPIVIDHTKRPQNNGQKKDVAPTDPMELLYGGRVKQAISDVMMHFSGKVDVGVRVTYTKFRGETPPPLDITFSQDEGFQVKDRPRNRLTPAEQKLMAFINSHLGEWHRTETLVSETRLHERTARRALDALAKRRLLLKQEADGRSHSYRNNPSLPGAFER